MIGQIRNVLDKRFVQYDRLATALAVALQAKMNLWLWGPGGYGKSDMVETVLRGLGHGAELFIQAFGPGMTPEKLLGNMDIKKFKREDEIGYALEKSFMNYRFAVFEEMPDAAKTVLFLLKDILAARQYRDGSTTFPMKTETIIVCSNLSPESVAQEGPDAEALIQRWPLVLRVEWEDFGTEAYTALLHKRQSDFSESGVDGKSAVPMLANFCSDLAAKGERLPPRIVLGAAKALVTYAKIHGHSDIKPFDFQACLSSVRGMSGADFSGVVRYAQRSHAEKQLADAERMAKTLDDALDNMKSVIDVTRKTKELKALLESVHAISVDESTVERKKNLIRSAENAILTSREKAESLVH